MEKSRRGYETRRQKYRQIYARSRTDPIRSRAQPCRSCGCEPRSSEHRIIAQQEPTYSRNRTTWTTPVVSRMRESRKHAWDVCAAYINLPPRHGPRTPQTMKAHHRQRRRGFSTRFLGSTTATLLTLSLNAQTPIAQGSPSYDLLCVYIEKATSWKAALKADAANPESPTQERSRKLLAQACKRTDRTTEAKGRAPGAGIGGEPPVFKIDPQYTEISRIAKGLQENDALACTFARWIDRTEGIQTDKCSPYRPGIQEGESVTFDDTIFPNPPNPMVHDLDLNAVTVSHEAARLDQDVTVYRSDNLAMALAGEALPPEFFMTIEQKKRMVARHANQATILITDASFHRHLASQSQAGSVNQQFNIRYAEHAEAEAKKHWAIVQRVAPQTGCPTPTLPVDLP